MSENNNKSNLDKLPPRVKYYLLDWKDQHLREYLEKYGRLRLNDLTLGQLNGLFYYVTGKDRELVNKLEK